MIARFVWGGDLLIGQHGSPEMWSYLLANMGIQKWLFGTSENMHSCHKWLFDKRPFLKRPFEFQGPILEPILVVGLGCSLGVRFGFLPTAMSFLQEQLRHIAGVAQHDPARVLGLQGSP